MQHALLTRGTSDHIPHQLGNKERTVMALGFTFGASHVQTVWDDVRHESWDQIVALLTNHVIGPKEGSCIVPAVFADKARKKESAVQIDMAFLDSDTGATLDQIVAAIKACGWDAVVASTHSHMSVRTEAALVHWDRYFGKHKDASVADFLRDERGYLPPVTKGAQLVQVRGTTVLIAHAPCPKFRIAIPLVRPWRADGYVSQAVANAAWKTCIEAVAAALGLSHDQACTDTSRLFFLPRCPASIAPETAVVTGERCDIFLLDPPASSTPPEATGDLFSQTSKTTSAPSSEYIDPETGEVIDLVAWAKRYGRTFQVVTALKARRPGVFTGLVTDGLVHIDCPNAFAHSNPGRDQATFVVDAGAGSGTEGFAIHCRHGHCTGKDRLFFLRHMLVEGWLATGDLTAPEFQLKVEPEADPSEPFPLAWLDDIRPVLDAKDFVQDVLIEGSAVVVYGESNAGKTFWTTDLALHVAAGKEWNGRRVEQGAVIYCVLEGGDGFRNRVAAWRDKERLSRVPFAAIAASINLMDPEADTQRLIEAINRARKILGQPVKLVVVDTLSRAMSGGNENASDSMGFIVKNTDRIRTATGCCVLFIHHSGKDQARGARGHSLLRAAVDTEIEIIASPDSQQKTATVVKQRDIAKGAVFPFTLRTVALGENRHGEPVTTCLVEPFEDDGTNGTNGTSSPKRVVPAGAKVGLRALQIAIGHFGTPLPDHKDMPAGVIAVSHHDWRAEYYQLNAGSDEGNKKAFQRAQTYLLANNIITVRHGRVWLVKAEDEATK